MKVRVKQVSQNKFYPQYWSWMGWLTFNEWHQYEWGGQYEVQIFTPTLEDAWAYIEKRLAETEAQRRARLEKKKYPIIHVRSEKN